MWGGGASGVRKMYCTWPWKLAAALLYNPLKSPVGAHVHKTTYRPLVDTAFMYNAFDVGKSITRARALEILTFLSPKWHLPDGSMTF